MNPIILANRLFVPKEQTTIADLERVYEQDCFVETTCRNCVVFKEDKRPSQRCYTCTGDTPGSWNGYTGHLTQWKEVCIKGRDYYSLPVGNLREARDELGLDFSGYKDMRCSKPMDIPISFTGKLYTGREIVGGKKMANQIGIVKKFWQIPGKSGIIQAPPRTGKCLVGSTLINTQAGWLHFNEMKFAEGYHDYQLSIDGPYGQRAATKSFKEKTKETIRVTTTHGFKIEGTPEHFVLVVTPELCFVWRRLDRLNIDDQIVSLTDKNSPMWSLKNKISLDEANLLGWMTANGRGRSFSSGDTDVVNSFLLVAARLTKMEIRVESTRTVPNYHLHPSYQTTLKDLGFKARKSSEKTIPLKVRLSTKEIMHTFLSAYFECDSGANGSNIELVTASERLAHDLHIILHQGFNILGTLQSLLKKATNSRNPKIKRYWSITLSGIDAKRFITTFPRSKVASQFADRFTKEITTSQEIHKYYQPYIVQYIRMLYQKHKISSNPRSHNYKMYDGTISHNFKAPFRWLNGNGTYQIHASQSAFDCVDWSIWIPKIEKMSPLSAKVIENFIKNKFKYERVSKIERFFDKKWVYDVTIPSGHAFTANSLTSHNTVIGAFLTCAFKMKTLIVAHETILLRQFEAEIRRFTNINAQERLAGRKLMRVVETEKHFTSNVEILLLNYQKLISEIGIARVIKYLQKQYGFLLVDEIHRAGTDHYEGLLSRVDPKHRVAFSATPKRKDGKEIVFLRGIGPVVVVAKTDTLKPTVHVKYTDFAPKREYRGRPAFVRTCTWLSECKERNIDIVQQVFRDLRSNPRHIIVIPVMKIIHAKTLVAMINKQARINYEKRGESWPDQVADILWREADKKTVIDNVKARRIRVLVAIQKFVKEGTNIPVLSIYYSIFPQNNRVSTEQGTARVLTPLDGKPDPLIRVWVDPIGICISCFRNTNSDSFTPLKYKISEESKPIVERFMKMVRNKKTGKWEDPVSSDEFISMW